MSKAIPTPLKPKPIPEFLHHLHLFDIRADIAWTSLAPLPKPRCGSDAFVINGKIWVVGGWNLNGNILDYKTDFNIYDPALHSWSTRNSPWAQESWIYQPEKFVATQEGKIYGLGIWEPDTHARIKMVHYDPATNQITEKANMLVEALMAGVVTLNDGRICVIGGFNDTNGGTYLNTVQVYDPVSDSWSLGEPMPMAKDSLAAVAIGSKVFIFGGFTNEGGSTRELDTVQVYNVDNKEWSDRAPMPTGRSCLAAVMGSNGNIYVIGGLRSCSGEAIVEEYNRTSNSWKAMAPMPTARWILAATALGDKIYTIGGVTRVGDYQPGNPNVMTLTKVEEGTLSKVKKHRPTL